MTEVNEVTANGRGRQITHNLMAEEAKAKGNAAMGQRNFEEAIKHYSDAIALDSANHVLYSNRSAAYASLGKYEEALQDGEKTIEVKPDWVKVNNLLSHFFVFISLTPAMI